MAGVGRTATVDGQTDRVQTRRSLNGQEQPLIGGAHFRCWRTMTGLLLVDEVWGGEPAGIPAYLSWQSADRTARRARAAGNQSLAHRVPATHIARAS